MTSVPAGRHADRTVPRRTLTIGVIAFGIAYAGLTRDTHSWLALTPWFVFAGIGIGCSAFGLRAAVQSFGNFAASGIAGVLWTVASPSWAFAYLTGWMVLAAAILMRLPPRPASRGL